MSGAAAGSNVASGVASAGYRWYLGSQVLSIVGTMMGYTALFWLALHIRYGGPATLAAVDAAQCLPMLLFSRRAGTIVGRHRAARVAMITQSLLAAGALAIGFPLLAGWMTIWYLVPISFLIGCVQCVNLPARQTFMLDLVGPGELRRGSSLFATVTGLAKISVLHRRRLVPRRDRGPGPAVQSGAAGCGARPRSDAGQRLRRLLDLPRGVQAAVALALLVGGFGLQFAVTNPLMASKVFHLGSIGFGLFGTFMAVGGIAGNYYSSRRQDPCLLEFAAWSLVFGVAECLAAVMPVAWAYDLVMVVLGAATQLSAAR